MSIDQLIQNAAVAGGGSGGGTGATPRSLAEVIGLIFSLLDFFFGLSALGLVAMIVYAGFLRLTAAENPGGVKQSTGTITMAIIGFTAIMASVIIIKLVAETLGYTADIQNITL